MAQLQIQIPDEMKRELEEALPAYFPADEWARNQLVPAIAQFVEANREVGQASVPARGVESPDDLDELLEARIDQYIDGDGETEVLDDLPEAGD